MDKEQLWEEHFCHFPAKDFNVLLGYRKYIIGYAEELARRMCDKQKEICDQAFSNYIFNIADDPYCVINSPYPEELL